MAILSKFQLIRDSKAKMGTINIKIAYIIEKDRKKGIEKSLTKILVWFSFETDNRLFIKMEHRLSFVFPAGQIAANYRFRSFSFSFLSQKE